MQASIVAFADSAYRSIAFNWLRAIERVGLLEAVDFVALDEALHNALIQSGVACSFLPPPAGDLNSLWRHRTRTLRAKIEASDRPIIHSDTDAVWLNSPIERLLSEPADLVFSQGTIWPPESLSHRGFVLCCGLFMARPTSQCHRFFSALEPLVDELQDDQWAVNRLVDREVRSWQIVQDQWLELNDERFVISNESMRGSGPQISVTVLPHAEFPRLMTERESIVQRERILVGHPLSGKTAAETQVALHQNGLWFEERVNTAYGPE